MPFHLLDQFNIVDYPSISTNLQLRSTCKNMQVNASECKRVVARANLLPIAHICSYVFNKFLIISACFSMPHIQAHSDHGQFQKF